MNAAAPVPAETLFPLGRAVRRGLRILVLAIAAAIALGSPLQGWLRLQLFDAYQRLLPRERATAPAMVVGIDERSLAAYGQWPWPRTELARIVESIARGRPAAIGLDIFMSEPDRLSPQRIIELVPDVDPALALQIAALPDNDQRLAGALRGHGVVLGMAAGTGGPVSAKFPLPTPPVRVHGDGEGLARLPTFEEVLRSRPIIESAAAGHGLMNTIDERGVVRRMLLLGRIGEAVVPSLGVELLRIATGTTALDVHVGQGGVEAVGLGDVIVPTLPDGRLWVRYGRFEPGRYVSALELLEGGTDPSIFEGKLVLVGITGLGLVDQAATPLGEAVPGIEMHVQLLENIFDRAWLVRPGWAGAAEALLFLLAALVMMQRVPAARPRQAFLIAVAVLALLAAAGLAAFVAGILVDVATPALAAALVFAIVLGGTLSEAQRQRRDLARRLQEQREAAARFAGELDAARRVQLGMLPEAPGTLAGDARVDLRAFMQPAREVGGDLYDFFMLDPRTLFVLIGDVSDKGLPAAMFMASVKASCKGAALHRPDSLPALLRQAESQLVLENRESLFATVLAMTLDLETGTLRYCNAGHEPIYVVAPDGGSCRRLDECGGPPLCVMEGFPYPVDETTLRPGEMLCLVTDGITEAASARQELYGRPRLQSLLGSLPGADPAAVLNALRIDLTRFTVAAEQADDQAVVVLRWNGPVRAVADAVSAP